MTNADESLLSFCRCSTLDGHVENLTTARRGGRTIPVLTPSWSDGGPERTIGSRWLDDPRYYINLTDVERQTWRRILSGASIATIAAEQGVSRAAIYARIQGNRLGQGGMIGKNFWVLLWWRLRQRLSGDGQ